MHLRVRSIRNRMKVIKPVVFQEPMLISTTAINADANYSATTTYALNAKVTYNSKVYHPLQLILQWLHLRLLRPLYLY